MSTDLEPTVVPVNPMTILDRLTAQNVDPDKLGRVIDLVREWNKDQAVKAFARAMNDCQAEMAAVVKDAENKQTSSVYAKLETVNNMCKPIYTKHGFSISFTEGKAATEGEVRTIAIVLHAEGHEREYWSDLARDGIGIKGNANMTPVHGKGSTYTYQERYLLRRIFNITIAGEDNDVNGAFVPLSDDQVVQINTLLDRCYKEIKDYDSQGFWSWIHDEKGTKKRLNELSATRFDDAILGLNNKLKQGGKK